MTDKKKINEAALDIMDAEEEYYDHFGEEPPRHGYDFRPNLLEYASLLRRCIKEDKKLRVKSSTEGKRVLY